MLPAKLLELVIHVAVGVVYVVERKIHVKL